MKLTLDLTPAQIDLLREGLDELPLAKYISIIVPMLEQLPITESDVSTARGNADRPPAPLASVGVAGGLRMTAYTRDGVMALPALQRALEPLGGKS